MSIFKKFGFIVFLLFMGCSSAKTYKPWFVEELLSFKYSGFFITPLDAPFSYTSIASFRHKYYPGVEVRKENFDKSVVFRTKSLQQYLDKTVIMVKKRLKSDGIIQFKWNVIKEYKKKISVHVPVIVISGIAIKRK